MNRHDILALIKKSGTTITQLAIDAGLSPGACSKALTAHFPAAERAIAERIGLPLHQVWPKRYRDDDSRKLERRSYSRRSAPSKAV